MKRIYKNWAVHNLIAHPLSEVIYWFVRPFGKDRATDVSGWIHDLTVPDETGTERGRCSD